MTRRMGDGFEPHVDEEDGALTYSIPVDSGQVFASFSFAIRKEDLRVLLADPWRRAVLEVVAETLLRATRNADTPPVTQTAFYGLVARILHAASVDLEAYIDQMSRDHRIAIRRAVEETVARRAAP